MIKIKIQQFLTPEAHERLEDGIRDYLWEYGVKAIIENTVTGNTTHTFKTEEENT